ncbi:MAG: Gfo/Idh/MocA family oxidoreductase [Verrucomicrobia bacterium]|nr:Gfo/Idh/MocA family oxidoreductase [Verrucomicrobiota bacterium]
MLHIGIVGSGFISGAYWRASHDFPNLRIISCSDVNPAAAEEKARDFGIEAQSVEQLLTNPKIDLVLNLTIPQSHAPISLRALQAGKHVYSEKPLALSTNEALDLLSTAKAEGKRVGVAPDTFLGGGQQTARRLIDRGDIGIPIGGTAFILLPGHEHWHPNPDFFYQPGGGPVFDMGPYYLTALVNLLGPVRRVISIGKRTFNEREIQSGSRKGERIPVAILTHFNALLEFFDGPVVSLHASFDVQGHTHWPIEIYGTGGTLQVPDPNTFGGPVRLLRRAKPAMDVPLTHGFSDRDYRILGVAEMAKAIDLGRPHRVSADLGFHVLEVMEAIVEGATKEMPIEITSRCNRPEALPPQPRLGSLA